MFELKKNPKKWILCGTGSGWELAPKESTAMIMCLNDFIFKEKYGVNFDYLCIMDILDEKPQIVSGINNLGEVIARINQFNVPLIAPFKYEEVPLSEAFPIDECVKKFGLPYFTNTICYMIAFALLKGAEEIQIFGVNQASTSEYSDERGGVEYWIGVANGLGVSVSINGDQSQLLRFKGRYGRGLMYGYLMSYEELTRSQNKFGESIVRKLTRPVQPATRTVRKVK